MSQSKNYFNLVIILIIFLFSFAIIFPKYCNKALDYLDLGLPHIPEKTFNLGLDLEGGSHLVYGANLKDVPVKEREDRMQGLRDIIERRIRTRGSYGLGVTEPEVRTQKMKDSYRLIIELPGIKDVKQAIKEIGKTPYLEFKQERTQQEREEIINNKLAEEPENIQIEVVCSSPEFLTQFINLYQEDPCFESTNLTGQYLEKAILEFDQTTLEPQVSLEFDKEGADIFGELTSKNIDRVLGIYVDGSPISLPVVREAISGGKAQITGSFNIEEAKELAGNLNAGALTVHIDLISQTTVGPTLGAVSLKRSLRAGIFGFIAVILFIIIFYRVSGLLAALALIVYAGVLLSLFKLIPVTLTLAAIGGVILSVGMAVDANVLIFERMKEERKKGGTFSKSLEISFSRAWPSIRDSNITTLIVALVMFSFGTSFVKAFAVSLSMGIMVSLFSALFVTRSFLKIFIKTKIGEIKRLWG